MTKQCKQCGCVMVDVQDDIVGILYFCPSCTEWERIVGFESSKLKKRQKLPFKALKNFSSALCRKLKKIATVFEQRRKKACSGRRQGGKMQVYEIIENYLKENGYDGLFNSDFECGCETGGLFSECREPQEDCRAGYKVPCDGKCDDPDTCEFHIVDKKNE